MFITPRIRDELNHWETELKKAEINVSLSINPFEEEHWKHMDEYSTHKILLLEKEMYPETS